MMDFWNRSKASAVSIGDFKGSDSIQLEDVAARINGRSIIENITTQFSRGEFTVLLGPNGAGKSTLLKTITGEVNTTAEPRFSAAQAQIGSQSNSQGTFPHCPNTVRYRLILRLRKWSNLVASASLWVNKR